MITREHAPSLHSNNNRLPPPEYATASQESERVQAEAAYELGASNNVSTSADLISLTRKTAIRIGTSGMTTTT
ncbi:hypothetical protein BDZ89DRAFT_1063328 [Hymenopellis radicata]|nr:hypothetical protein BDZ89DRAFT_1063328 [Hymenopellis radicata]